MFWASPSEEPSKDLSSLADFSRLFMRRIFLHGEPSPTYRCPIIKAERRNLTSEVSSAVNTLDPTGASDPNPLRKWFAPVGGLAAVAVSDSSAACTRCALYLGPA